MMLVLDATVRLSAKIFRVIVVTGLLSQRGEGNGLIVNFLYFLLMCMRWGNFYVLLLYIPVTLHQKRSYVYT